MSALSSSKFLVPAAVAALLVASGGASAQSNHNVTATFDVRLGPMQIGRGTYEVRLSPGAYAIGVSARVTGVARILAGGEGTASAQGVFSGRRVVPELYSIANTAGDLNNDIRLVMRGGAVASERVEPPSIPLPDRIPIHANHRREVVDPLSAFVFPVEGDGELVQAASCNRTLRVYDGRARYDIALTYGRTEELRIRDYEGPALICQARYTPVAGHRRLSAAESAQYQYRDMEAWLVPVRGSRVLVLYRMQVGTGVGRFSIQATRLSILPVEQHAAR